MSRAPLFRTGAIEKNRLEAFSDGVIAIVITLLVLEVNAPEGLPNEAALWRASQRGVRLKRRGKSPFVGVTV